MPTRSLIRRQARFASIEQYFESGLNQRQFCEREQINYATFQYWLKKYRDEMSITNPANHDQHSFVPLSFASPQASTHDQPYTIEYANGVVLHINGPINPRQLIQLIRAQD